MVTICEFLQLEREESSLVNKKTNTYFWQNCVVIVFIIVFWTYTFIVRKYVCETECEKIMTQKMTEYVCMKNIDTIECQIIFV